MKKKILLVFILLLGLLAIGVKPVQASTCDKDCKSLGYEFGWCRSWDCPRGAVSIGGYHGCGSANCCCSLPSVVSSCLTDRSLTCDEYCASLGLDCRGGSSGYCYIHCSGWSCGDCRLKEPEECSMCWPPGGGPPAFWLPCNRTCEQTWGIYKRYGTGFMCVCFKSECGDGICDAEYNNENEWNCCQDCGSPSCGCEDQCTAFRYTCEDNTPVKHTEDCPCSQDTHCGCQGYNKRYYQYEEGCRPLCSCSSEASCRCIEGRCGAECDSNSDCNDGNPLTTDKCERDCTCSHTLLPPTPTPTSALTPTPTPSSGSPVCTF